MNHAGIQKNRERCVRRRRGVSSSKTEAEQPVFGVWRGLCTGFALGVAAFALVTCGQPTEDPGSARAASRSFGTLPPPPPTAGLVMPAFASEWAPPMLTAGDPAALAQALAGADRWSLWLDARLTRGEQGARLPEVLASLGGAQVSVGGRLQGGVQGFLSGAELPLERLEQAPNGRPRYSSRGVGRIAKPGGEVAEAVLVVGEATLDLQRWNALEAFTVGSCASAFRDLAQGQEDSLALLEPFLDRGDAILWRSFRAGLDRELPALHEELKPYAELRSRSSFNSEQEFDTHLCGQGYWRYIEIYHRCRQSAESCLGAPRIFLQGGLKIGLPGPDTSSLDRCPELIGRDYVALVRELAVAASRDAIRGLRAEWSVLADRLGLVSELYVALEDLCEPRRRRFSVAAIAMARRRLRLLAADLGSADHEVRGASWVTSAGLFEVSGVGQVAELARFEGVALNQEIRAQVRALQESILGMARCRHPSGELPLVVLALRDGAVSFLGYFYEEELLCGDLPPLGGFSKLRDARTVSVAGAIE